MSYTKPDKSKDYAFILGASSGFGEATALELAQEGFNIIGVHMDRGTGLKKVKQIIKQIEGYGVEAIFFNKNAASDKNRQEVLQTLTEHFAGDTSKQVKILMHSLAFGSLAPFISQNSEAELSHKQMDMTMNVMANSLIYWTRDLFHAKLLARGSKIFSMTSSGSLQVVPYYGAVSAAKATLEAHTRQLALELAPYNITVNCIRAGVTFTPALRKIPGHEMMINLALSQIPFKRLTQPLDVAKFISAMATSDEHWATGNIYNVDGGEVITAYHSQIKN